VGVKTSGLEAILRESGSPTLCLGALQLVSDFIRRAREAERAPEYHDAVKICEVAIDSTKLSVDNLVNLFAEWL
jgi:hypothetical protein